MASWEQRFTELIRDRGAALVRYGFLLCGDSTESADLVQEALVRVFGRARDGTDLSHVEAYVRRAMLRVYLDRRRRQARWRSVRHLLSAPSRQDSAEDDVLDRDTLRRVLGCLSPRQRACLVLRYYEDLSIASVADELQCSEGAVKRHLSDALRRLEPCLGPADLEGQRG